MASKQKTRFAVLGLLTWKPMSGYDIKKLVDVSLSHFWKENYGQLYPTLELLVQEELAKKKQARTSGKRQRFVYTITAKGRRTFVEWLSEPTSTPVVRNELQLKFFLSCYRPTEVTVRLVEEYRVQQQTLLDQYLISERVLRVAIRDDEYSDELEEILAITQADKRKRAKQCEVFLLTLRHGILVVQARLAWCEEVLTSLQSRRDT